MALPIDEIPALENPELSAAMTALEEDETEEHRQQLYEALIESTLILPAPEQVPFSDADAGPEPIAEDEAISLVTFENDEGATLLIAFTDEDAALAWEPAGLPFIGLRGFHLISLADQNEIDGVVLNPASTNAYHLNRDEIVALAQGNVALASQAAQRPTAPAGMTVLISAPEETPPESWQEALQELLASYPSIETAYLFQLHIPPEGARNVIGVVLYEGMDDDAQERMMRTMMSEVEEQLPIGQSLEFIVLDDPNFLQTVQDTVAPIYEQKT